MLYVIYRSFCLFLSLSFIALTASLQVLPLRLYCFSTPDTTQKKADRLLNLVVNGTINEEIYKEKVKESNETITRLKDNLNNTIESGNDWRTTMQKTLEVLFDGKRRFENGDILVKRELLQSLGSNKLRTEKK